MGNETFQTGHGAKDGMPMGPPEKPARPVTIRDVARLAGVSVGTVSNVLNCPHRVRPETALKVHQAIRALRYVPNAAARSLVTRRTGTIGVAITSITNLINAEIVSGIEQVGKRHGYRVLLAQSGMHEQPYMDDCVQAFCEKGMDGAVGKFPTAAVEKLLSYGIPVVSFDVDLDGLPADSVMPDYRIGVQQALEHLWRLGHRRIAFLAAPAPWQATHARLQAYLDAMTALGGAVPDDYVAWGDWSAQGGRQAMEQVLDLAVPPTAVLAANDLMAMGAIEAAAARGLRVPGDVSVIGMDNNPLGALVQPPLTTVSMHALEIGLQSMELLLSRIQGGPGAPGRAPRRVSVATALVVRASTGPVRERR
ncbi:MAG: LacI family transcriptional regulator [Limnochordales bacterium]|nr:LacI family DNA-binding transcriptional regulator [Limnochordales bacterium]